MTSSDQIAVAPALSTARLWLGAVLLVGGLLGHLLAARAIGGYYVAYRDHIGGFVFFTVLSGAIIAVLGRRFWRGRHDVTLLTLGALQALFGYIIYLMRFHIA